MDICVLSVGGGMCSVRGQMCSLCERTYMYMYVLSLREGVCVLHEEVCVVRDMYLWSVVFVEDD